MSTHSTKDKPQWVIWNGSLGVAVLTGMRVVDDEGGRAGFLEPPFDFVGPLSLDDLEIRGRTAFGACLIMSRQRWRQDQADLRHEARQKRHAQARRLSFRWKRSASDHTQHRDILKLPRDGALEPSAIKAAFRRMARTAHPDAGGTNEQFHRITEARDALLESTREPAA